MPPTVALLRGVGGPVTFSTFPPGNYVASTHSFLSAKILSWFNQKAGVTREPVSWTYKGAWRYTLHWINGSWRVKPLPGEGKERQCLQRRGSSGMHPGTKGNKWSLLGEQLPIRTHSFVHHAFHPHSTTKWFYWSKYNGRKRFTLKESLIINCCRSAYLPVIYNTINIGFYYGSYTEASALQNAGTPPPSQWNEHV